MKIVAYADDFETLEHLTHIVTSECEWVTDSAQLAGYSGALMIISLSADVRANEPLLRSLVSSGNYVLLLQRVPILESAKFYLSLGIRGYGNSMMHRVYVDAALETLRSNMIWLHPEFTARLVLEVPSTSSQEFMSLLSEREQEIATLLLEGKTNHEIGEILHITARTVKAHASHLYHKLQVKDRLDFALRYR